MVHAVRGGRVVLDGGVVGADILIDGSTIVDIVDPGAGPDGSTVDASGGLVAPGLIDLQCNGSGGVDVSAEPERLPELSRVLAASGVTSFLPTVITGPADIRRRVRDAIVSSADWPGAVPLGVHLEGPLIAPSRHGAHPEEHVARVADTDTAWWSGDEGVLVVTLAPELDAVMPLITELAGRGVVVSLGHSDADRATVRAAIDAGADLVTHLFNAMSPVGHREPGLAGTALTDERLRVGLIVDGVHVDPDIVRMAWRLLGPDRCVLVSDSVAATASARPTPGPPAAPAAARTADGTLAGSLLTLDQAVRNLVAMTGCAPHDALRCATRNPAEVLGRRDLGRIQAGARADLVIFDDALAVGDVIIGGRRLAAD